MYIHNCVFLYRLFLIHGIVQVALAFKKKGGSMAEKMKVTSVEPCKICGKPDYCFRLRFEDGNTLHCCARTADKAVSSGGYVYIHKKLKQTNIGVYNYYQEEEEYQRSLAEFKRAKGLEYSSNGYNRRVTPVDNVTRITATKGSSLIRGEVVLADVDKLDRVYRRLLSLLKLEKKDYLLLKSDWNSPTTGNLIEKVLSIYPIRSLPPSDDVRNRPFAEKFESPLRKEVCRILVAEFGSLEGVPGFFIDDTGEWDLAGSEGILFPIYEDGKMIRVRLRESYPDIKGFYQGKEGNFKHFYTKKGEHCWTFTAKDVADEKPVYVYSPYTKNIQLKKDGCPAGKASGKYKNLSSVWEKKLEDGTVVNGYGSKGTRSGSNASLYCRPTDNFSTVYVTEGEKKAIVANLLLGVPCVSLPGTGCFSMLFEESNDGSSIAERLANKGSNLFVIAYDADKSTNVRVLQNEKSAIEEFKKRNFRIAVGEWNANFGKGLDDILVTGVRPSIYICS